jgi:hypothetical protein
LTGVLTVADIGRQVLESFLTRFGLELVVQGDQELIAGSFWGDSEAGVIGHRVYVRPDTPVHSFLHESCHVICMDDERRKGLDQDAGGDNLEEAAVCYLQVLLADYIDGVGRERIMRDMDEWGYSFRLGSTRAWFEKDAEDAQQFLTDHELIDQAGAPTFTLRR